MYKLSWAEELLLREENPGSFARLRVHERVDLLEEGGLLLEGGAGGLLLLVLLLDLLAVLAVLLLHLRIGVLRRRLLLEEALGTAHANLRVRAHTRADRECRAKLRACAHACEAQVPRRR